MKREHRLTSKLGEMHIAPHKESHKDKILVGLEKLKIGGTQDEIAEVTGLRTDQVWKRMVDLVRDGRVFDTGLMRKLKSGLPGIVWQISKPTLVTDEKWFADYQEERGPTQIYQQSLF